MWLGRLAGVDVRASGSGNIGATNVARAAGLRLGLITLAGDVAKGAIPVLLAHAAGFGDATLMLVGLSVFYGHVFSIFARFRGGKGVATAAGVFLVLSPLALSGAVVVFALIARLTRIVSVASLSAGASLPLFLVLIGQRGTTLWTAVIIAVSLAATHRDNLRRLAQGKEPRFGLPR